MQVTRHGQHGVASVVRNHPPTLTPNSHLYLQSWQATAHAAMDQVSDAASGNRLFLSLCYCVQLPKAPAYEARRE
jgi:hypothetical protein